MAYAHQAQVDAANLAFGPGGDLYVGSKDGRVFRCLPNGDLEFYARPIDGDLRYFGFGADGQLWFTCRQGLYRMPVGGTPQRVWREVECFDLTSQGHVIAIDDTQERVLRIEPNGKMTVLAVGFRQAHSLDVGPDDQIVLIDELTGDLHLGSEQPGAWRVLASGFGHDASPRFAPEGTLYVLHHMGHYTVNIESGELTQLTGPDNYRNLGTSGLVDSGGVILLAGQDLVYKVDTHAQSVSLLTHFRGSAEGLAIGPDKRVYLVYGDRLPGGTSELFAIGDQGQLERVAAMAGGCPGGMSFGTGSKAYILVTDSQLGGIIYAFDAADQSIREHRRIDSRPSSLAVNPLTDLPAWPDDPYGPAISEELPSGEVSHSPLPEGVSSSYLSFASDGTLYAMFWFGQPSQEPRRYGVFRHEGNGRWTELVDLSGKDAAVTMGRIAACPDGNIYAITSIDGRLLNPPIERSSFNALLRIAENGELSTIGYDFNNDAPALDCCVDEGMHFFFPTPAGIYHIYR